MRRSFLYLAAIFAFLGLLCFAGLEWLYGWRVKPTLLQNQALQEHFSGVYAEDVEFLSRLLGTDILSPHVSVGTSEAARFLNAKFFWTPKIVATTAIAPTAKQPVVAQGDSETLLRLRADWMKQATREKKLTADLSFFDSLEKYKTWDIETASPIETLAHEGQFVPPAQLPTPEISDLLTAVKIRLIRGAQAGDMIEALNDVRQFARLLLTTENMSMMLAGIAALDYERVAYRYYVDERGFIAALWTPIDRNVTRRGHRALLGGRGFLHAWTKPELLEAKFLSKDIPPGFCAIVNEAFPTEFSLRPHLDPHWPFELDLRPQYTLLDRIYQRATEQCRLKYLKSLVEHGSFSKDLPGPILLARLPYWRRIFAMKASLAMFNGFDGYSDTPLNAPIVTPASAQPTD